MNTPVLETKRLILRPFRQDDARTVYECWESDPDVAKYMFWTSHPLESGVQFQIMTIIR